MAELDKEQRKGLLWGSLLSAGIAAAQGDNLADAIYKAALGGSSAYTGGLEKIYDQKKQELEEQRMTELINASKMRNMIDLGQFGMQKESFPLDQALKQGRLEETTFNLAEKQKQSDALQRIFESMQGGEVNKQSLINVAQETQDPQLLYQALGMSDMVETEIAGQKVKVPASKLIEKPDTSLSEWEVRRAAAEGDPTAIAMLAQKMKEELEQTIRGRKPDKPSTFAEKKTSAKKALLEAGNKKPTEEQIAKKMREMYPPVAQGTSFLTPFDVSQTGGKSLSGKEPYIDPVTKTLKYR